VATAVMRMPESQITGETEEKLQRQPRDEEEKVRRQPVEKDEEKLRMKPMEEDKEEVTLQAKEAPAHTPKVRAGLAARIQALRGGGRQLPESVRAFFEPRFGYDFSNVRVHTDADAADIARSINARAFTVGRDIVLGSNEYAPQRSTGRQLLAHELTHVVQQGAARGRNSLGSASAASARSADTAGRSTVRVGRFSSAKPPTVQCEPDKPPQLLRDFAAKFPDAAALIGKSPEAVQLVNEAVGEGVKFGGYAEDGPGKTPWPYTIASTKTVYVPKGRDKIAASSDFLFELNNAIRGPKLAKLEQEAAKGSAGKLNAKAYAREKVELEVEGMLRTGKIWFEMKKKLGGGKQFDKYDNDFFLLQYEAFKAGKKTKDDIVKDVLRWKSGAEPTKTTEQYYMDQYNRLSGGK
jgi:hypothetical protein